MKHLKTIVTGLSVALKYASFIIVLVDVLKFAVEKLQILVSTGDDKLKLD